MNKYFQPTERDIYIISERGEMYLCVLAGILLATPCLADDDPLLEMSVPDPHTSPGLDDDVSQQNAAFMTDEIR